MLAFLLLAGAAISTDLALHQTLHNDSPNGHICLACSLVKGLVTLDCVADLTLIALFLFLFSSPLTRTSVWPAADFRLSLSRAPPVR